MFSIVVTVLFGVKKIAMIILTFFSLLALYFRGEGYMHGCGNCGQTLSELIQLRDVVNVPSNPPPRRTTVGILAVTWSTEMSALARLVPRWSSLLMRGAGSGSLVWCMSTRGMAAGVNRREPREHTPRWKQAHLKKKKRQREDAVERGEGAKSTHYPVMLTETIDALLEGMTPNAPDGGLCAVCCLRSLSAVCCLLSALSCLLSAVRRRRSSLSMFSLSGRP
jgi:hypothetical protein